MITTFVLGGLALNMNQDPMCLGHTAIDLINLGFRVIINLAATRSINVSSDAIVQNIKFIESLEEIGIEFVNDASEIKLT